MAATASLRDRIGDRLPFLRWSFIKFLISMKNVLATGQVGDGREKALLQYVLENAEPGNVDEAITAIDDFARHRSWLMNVGDEKGEILDAAIRRAPRNLLLELGTYCGYSALRTGRAMPAEAKLYCIEASADNAEIARAVIDHAGLGDRITVVVGMIGDGGTTTQRLHDEYGFGPGTLDFVFLDHNKDAYLPDLHTILDAGWLHAGSVVAADNVKLPGAPDYRAYMREQEGALWRTTEHAAHGEYQSLLTDLVLESEYL